MQNTKANERLLLLCAAQAHPFHILKASPFPILTSISLFFFLLTVTFHMHGLPCFGLPMADAMHASFLGLFITVMSWFISIVKESSQGFHTRRVQAGLRLGMILFIASEVMFFFAFFWAFFHYSLIPSTAVGAIWPPYGTQPLNVWGLPFANTLLLLASGVTITVAHVYILRKSSVVNAKGFFFFLGLTILLGLTFLFCQGYEYKYGVKFSWRDNIYGSIFFITTGFHGLHVTIGTMFLLFNWVRHLLATIIPDELFAFRSKDTNLLYIALDAVMEPLGYDPKKGARWAFHRNHHFGFEAAAWYWHFVDVVWLFLFLTVYWWGGQ